MNSPKSTIKNIFAISPYNEYYLPSVNKFIFEKMDSTTIYTNKFKSKELENTDTLHIFIGMDSGLLVNFIIKSKITSGSKYLFIELPEVIKLLSITIPEKLKKNIFICTEIELETILKSTEVNLYIVKNKYKTHYSLAASGNEHEDYTSLNYRVETSIEHIRFDSHVLFTNKIFLTNEIKNITENITPASILKNTFNGENCIVLGGGPSLDDNIHWIKKNRKNLFVISVSRIVNKLISNGIESDIIVTVDPHDISFDANKDLMLLGENNLLIHSNYTNSNIISQWKGAMLFTGDMLINDNLSLNNISTVGPTVTNSAINIAKEMGFSKIILSGVDLCHSKSGMSHTTGTYIPKGHSIGSIYEWVETYSGDMAETPYQLVQALVSLTAQVANSSNIKYINLSVNAARVEGIQHIDSSNIILEPIDINKLNSISPINIKSIFTIEKLLNKRDEIELVLLSFKKIIKKINNAIIICHKIKKNRGDRISLFKKIDSIENFVNKEFKTASYLVKFYGYYEFTKFLSTKKNDDWDQEYLNNQTLLYYQTYYDIAKILNQHFLNAQNRLESRILEHESPLNVTALLQQWTDDQQFGRAELLLENKTEAVENLSTDDIIKIQSHIEKFKLLLLKNENKKEKEIQEDSSNDKAYLKLNYFFQRKFITGIEKMIQYTESSKNKENIEIYYLAVSYRDYLNNEFNSSLAAAIKIPEDLMRENVLKHIIVLTLKLNKISISELYLSKIVQLNDEYQPQYAHIMTLQGKNQQALNIYLDYLDKYPEDIPALLKLGSFLMTVGEVESAKSVFMQVLSIDPKNHTAKYNLKD
ncbi:6-hydroxymethylpterin diphosphokinase MptE-like protein [Shewanella sp. AC91-MNA-CIBAN-0169]|uniref:6-hydroxymethylpterin diphosphokinase MptE-like protein n=1 Tax=Shewanella sp. AC91-MNA-CIBAN-0169 TaxID=3140466 RepID=UPI003322E31D